ncbi:MAG: endo-1,4-beta-xylanase [Verrucomicrobiota bacterium]
MKSIICLILLSVPSICSAADRPQGGFDLITTPQVTSAFAGEGGKTAEDLSDPRHPAAIRITVAKATPDQPWSAQVTCRFTNGSVKTGDRLLVSYEARRVDGAQGRAVAKVQTGKPDYAMVGITESAKFGAEWERIHQPFIAQIDAPEGMGELTIFLGEQIQSVEIADVRVLNYGPDFDLAKLPRQKQTYEGREPDAAWRTAALERIEKIRKAEMAVKLTAADGKPLSNTEVVIELDRHEFGFGSCVTRGLLAKEGPDGDKYREIAKRTFSRVVFENDLKPDSFPHDDQGRAELEKSMVWLEENGISIRGHYLIQEAVDGWTRDRLADPQNLKKVLLESVRERIAFAGDRVMEWDVINHPVAWKGAELLGPKGPPLDTLGMEVFREARALTKLPLCINEDQIFRPGPQQDYTYKLLEKLKADGVRVDGLGNQAHFHSSFLPSPEYLLQVTDRFTAVVPKQVITEFDVVTNGDDELAADYLRDSLIACFSHPAYDGFLLWGYWESSHWLPDAALWRKDWTPKANALAWEDWIGNRWHTRVTVKTDANGIAAWRGFKGTYRVGISDKKTTPFHPGSSAAPNPVTIP